MAQSWDLLLRTLDQLASKDLKRFKTYLCNGVEGFKPISRGKLESGDATDVASMMKDAYGGKCSVKLTLIILRKMNFNDLADKLQRDGAADSEKDDEEEILQKVKKQYQENMMKKYCEINECLDEGKNQTFLNKIYTDLYMTEGESEGVNTEHEVRRIEKRSERTNKIHCNDIFKSPEDENIKIVMTTGIAGIGKTVCVQKFILDWAEGRANQDVHFVIAIPLRQLNLMLDKLYSLQELLIHFHPELEEVIQLNMWHKLRIVIIFDGLDESKLQLDVEQSLDIHDPLDTLSLEVLIANLIKGNLLPNTSIWITSRPAAAKQVPSKYINKWTELQGFNDQQKEAYFKNKIKDQTEADRAIAHLKKSKSLYIMCHIPVFCWMLATVFLNISDSSLQKLPQTLTEIYVNFLLIETNRKGQKYGKGYEKDNKKLLASNREAILKLSELAYKQMEKGNILFYEDDLKECGIDGNDQSLYSGMCTEFFKSESLFCKSKVFCFTHLSIQEFLAAFFVFYSFVNDNRKALKGFTLQNNEKTAADMQGPTSTRNSKRVGSCFTGIQRTFTGCFMEFKASTVNDQLSMVTFLESAIVKSLQCKDGHLDLFLRFLLGISLESNQKHLQGLLTHKQSSSDSIKEMAQYIKGILHKETTSSERCMNLLFCLLEMKDNSLNEEIQQYINSGEELSPPQCSSLAYMLMMSEETLDDFDLKKYKTTSEGRKRLLVVLKDCKRARLAGCELTDESCEIVASVLQSPNSLLELDLSDNELGDSRVQLLSKGLTHLNCRLCALSFADCKLTDKSCEVVSSVLQSPNSLIDLDLSHNDLEDSGVQLLSKGLSSHNCKLQTLRLCHCYISDEGYVCLALSLIINPSCVKELDVRNNHPRESAQKLLSAALEDPHRNVKALQLSKYTLTHNSYEIVASVLQSPNSLIELDLSHNDLGDSGVQLLSKGLSSPHCKLQTLRLSDCLISEKGCGFLASALTSNPSHLTELDLSYNHPGESGLKLISARLEDPVGKLEILKSDHASVSRARPRLLRYARELTLDPNTAGRYLFLSERNRIVTCVIKEQLYPDHPERFVRWSQVLCKEGLSGRCYWEAEWSGCGADMAVVYKTIDRKGWDANSRLGCNYKSWSLHCSRSSYSASHNNRHTTIPAPSPCSSRVGVYLDWPAGTVSFYSVSPDTLTHLHTFHSTFTEPLYAGFRVDSHSVSLCQIT